MNEEMFSLLRGFCYRKMRLRDESGIPFPEYIFTCLLYTSITLGERANQPITHILNARALHGAVDLLPNGRIFPAAAGLLCVGLAYCCLLYTSYMNAVFFVAASTAPLLAQ